MKEFGETQEPVSKIYFNENDRHAFNEVATCLTVWRTTWEPFSDWSSTNAYVKK